ncbi:hypothetical protein NP233_g7139 [Leucocoprinus birnbaumii]|uniref:C2H2-type domain-containing protein n=1 Tax=Leucocoprinus birnbaumii TaxID=56174 RepID=A0AAD5VPT5_9AGAR|nr:hypothetical protein NP233_g7139 [Leucocoprinus birnbaumii]
MPRRQPKTTAQKAKESVPASSAPSVPPSPPRAAPDDDDTSSENPEEFSPLPNSRAGSQNPEEGDMDPVPEDSVTCLWDDCGIVFTHLPTLIDHIHNGEYRASFSGRKP